MKSELKACLTLACLAAPLAAVASVRVPGPEHARTLRRHTGIPSVAVSPANGRLWVTYYGGVTPGEDSNNYVMLVTSADGGGTWKEVLVADPDGAGPVRAFDPEVWIAPDGKLRWTWTERTVPLAAGTGNAYAGTTASPKSDELMMATLDAENEPQGAVAARKIARGIMMCKPAVLKDGTWLFPVAHWSAEPSACFYATTDGGATFENRGGITLPKEHRLFDEHVVTQLKNGDLLSFVRANWHVPFYESVSKDGGRTWSPAKTARFASASTRIFLMRLRSGSLLLVKNGAIDRDEGRSRLRAFVSRDEGATWQGGLMLDSRASATYPDGDQAADGLIHVTYDRNRTDEQEVLLASFTEEDAFRGRVVDAKRTRLRRVITRRHMPEPQPEPGVAKGPKYETPWKGRHVAFLGDSVTDARHCGCRKNYWGFLEDYLGIVSHVYGLNGNQWSDVPAQMRKLQEELGGRVDAIVILMGTNDYIHNVPLGGWYDRTETDYMFWGETRRGVRRVPGEHPKTFRGRINIALKKLKHEFPDQQIVLLTPLHRAWANFGGVNLQPDETYPNKLGLYIHDYAAAVREAGEVWSVPVIDLFADSGLYPLDTAQEKNFNRADDDLLHPSTRGHDRIARTLAARLAALPPDFKD